MSSIEPEFNRLLREFRTSKEPQQPSRRQIMEELILPLIKDQPRAKLMIPFLTKLQLNNMCWFEEPASTRYHGAELGGLSYHSLNVYKILSGMNKMAPQAHQLPEESVVICGLFHDLCKCGLYYPKHNKDRSLAATPFEVHDDFPFGHGEKSVVLINELLREHNVCLTKTEAILIRWHMGPFDRQYSTSESYLKKAYQYHLMLYLADHLSTMLEGEGEE